ncbi:MAG: hypothetical protein P4M11_15265 [Candidatus Pacebacteria bacterium]|nr:hypothetical protein [Candidatus Paceibacterota bacterium]
MRKTGPNLLHLFRAQSAGLALCGPLPERKEPASGIEEDIADCVSSLFRYDPDATTHAMSACEGEEEKATDLQSVCKRLEELVNRQNNNASRNRCLLWLHNGLEAIICAIKRHCRAVLRSKEPSTVTKNLKSLLNLFGAFFTGEPKIPHHVSQDDQLIQTIFPIIAVEELFDPGLRVLEDLMINRDALFPLAKLEDFYGYRLGENMGRIVAKFGAKQMGQFANVLALLIFEHNKADFTDIFAKKDQLTLYPNFKVTTINHAIVMNIPKLLSNLLFQLE